MFVEKRCYRSSILFYDVIEPSLSVENTLVYSIDNMIKNHHQTLICQNISPSNHSDVFFGIINKR